jgi:hypothetical protein
VVSILKDTLASGAPMSMKPCLLLLMILAQLVLSSSTLAQDGIADLTARFLKEAPPAWKEYTAQIKKYQGTFSFEITCPTHPLRIRQHYTFKMNDHAKVLSIATQRTGTSSNYDTFDVYAINPDYAFSLGRQSSSTLVKRSFFDLRKDQLTPSIPQAFENFSSDIAELVKFHSMPLVDLINKPEFKVMRCRNIGAGEEDLVEVLFECQQEFDPMQPLTELQGGAMVLDVKQLWTIRSFEYLIKTDKHMGTRKYEVQEFAKGDHPIPLPKRSQITHTYEQDGRTTIHHQKFELNLSKPAILPAEREFKLSAFGFNEP